MVLVGTPVAAVEGATVPLTASASGHVYALPMLISIGSVALPLQRRQQRLSAAEVRLNHNGCGLRQMGSNGIHSWVTVRVTMTAQQKLGAPVADVLPQRLAEGRLMLRRTLGPCKESKRSKGGENTPRPP